MKPIRTFRSHMPGGAGRRRLLAWIWAAGLVLGFGARIWTGLSPDPGAEPRVTVWRADLGRSVVMDLEEYVAGVVAAEMPALFHIEALKAQAVAARTYTLWSLGFRRSQAGVVQARSSAGPVQGQAWMSERQLWERWGPGDFERHWQKVRAAVAATRGIVLTYEGEPVEALYHSTSGGHTEDSEAYFLAARPYLRGVPDPYSRHSPHTVREVRLPRRQVHEALGVEDEGATVEVMARTETGRVQSLRVGDAVFSGREVRQRLGLASTWFDVRKDGDHYVLEVRGNGHGVGLSQYGADGMARAGYSYEEILAYYYRHSRLERWY